MIVIYKGVSYDIQTGRKLGVIDDKYLMYSNEMRNNQLVHFWTIDWVGEGVEWYQVMK